MKQIFGNIWDSVVADWSVPAFTKIAEEGHRCLLDYHTTRLGTAVRCGRGPAYLLSRGDQNGSDPAVEPHVGSIGEQTRPEPHEFASNHQFQVQNSASAAVYVREIHARLR